MSVDAASGLPLDRVLEGERARLEPLTEDHVPALVEVGMHPDIWRWMPKRVHDAAGMQAYVEEALAERDRGAALPFATVDRSTNRVVGTTRFGAVALENRRAEIGWTWLTPDARRTGINVEAKRLMLAFAFEELGLRRVEFKTDARNERSRIAIEAIGASLEGIFRKHMVTGDGGVRDSAYYSIIDDEWPEVARRLDRRMGREPS
ncbi:MAG: GNAT family protein [Planctomycetota bacterium]